MTRRGIERARREAMRFLGTITDLEVNFRLEEIDPDVVLSWHNPRYTAAIRRASMDLTRALARLRNGP